jgi:hypothetical protein
MRTLIPTFIALCAALAFATAGSAITNGMPDGSGHPEAGALLAQQAFSDGTWVECSGTLIAPRVFMTAAHCDEGVSRVEVTFESTFDRATGKTYWGTWHADPEFSQRASNPHDIAVVVLDQAVPGITPARLPAAGSLANLSKDQQFTPVGYGAQSVTSGKGGKIFHYADVRFAAVGTLNAIPPRGSGSRKIRPPETVARVTAIPAARTSSVPAPRRRTSSPGSRSPATHRAARPTSTTGSTRPLHAPSSAST